MIHYELRCANGHGFDGWFRSSAAFDQQAQSGLLDCPVCASASVSRAIMAPRLAKGAAPPKAGSTDTPAERAAETGAEATPQAPKPPAPALPPMPDQLRAALQRIRAEVERRCDYVGPRFAETARAIHAGQTPPRSIYGEASPEEAEALVEDGIEVEQIPWVPRADG